MYIESATDLSSKRERERGKNIYTKRTGNSYSRARQERDSGWVAAVRIYGQALRIQIGIYGCLPASTFNLSVFLICLCSYYLLCLLCLYVSLTYSIVLTIVYLNSTPTLSFYSRL